MTAARGGCYWWGWSHIHPPLGAFGIATRPVQVGWITQVFAREQDWQRSLDWIKEHGYEIGVVTTPES